MTVFTLIFRIIYQRLKNDHFLVCGRLRPDRISADQTGLKTTTLVGKRPDLAALDVRALGKIAKFTCRAESFPPKKFNRPNRSQNDHSGRQTTRSGSTDFDPII